MYSEQLNAKQAYDKTAQCQTPMGGNALRGYTLLEEASKSESYHFDEAAKAGNATRFLSAHPEFDEFVRLVRSGAIRF